MKKFFVAAVALAAWVSEGVGGIAVNWTAGGKVYGPDAGSGIAAETVAIWQLIYAGEDEMANEVSVSEDGWVSGDDVVLATRVVPVGGGTAEDGTEWDGCLAKVGGNSVFADVGWTGAGRYVFQRIYQATPQAGTPYFESGLFQINAGYAGGPDFPDMFVTAVGAESGVVHANRMLEAEVFWLSLAEIERTFSADEAGGNALGVNANVEWKAVSSVAWLTLKTESGSGNGTITYDVEANMMANSRSGTITVEGGGLSRTFTVVQDAASPILDMEEGCWNCTADATQGPTLGVVANVEWTVRTDAVWLTVAEASGSGYGIIIFYVEANLSTEPRTGTITLAGGGLTRTFTVTQAGVEPVLLLGEESRGFTAAASGQTLAVEANVPWTAQSSVWWLAVKTGSGTGNGSISYDVTANAGTNSRTGMISVTGGGLTRTFTATQNGTAVTVENVVAKQRFPWNGLVDITCTVDGLAEGEVRRFTVEAMDGDSGNSHKIWHFWIVRNGTNSVDRMLEANGDYHLVWDAQADLGAVRYSNMVVSVITKGERHDSVQLWAGGPYWADRNIGAEEPWEYGLYFWWGDTIGYRWEGGSWVASDGSVQNFSFDAGNTPTLFKYKDQLQSEGWITAKGVLAPEHDAAQVQWGGEWRMPTLSELAALVNNCDWTWTATNGVNGYVVRGRGDFADASIFLPAAGYGYGTSLGHADSYGFVWSSVPYSGSLYRSELLYFYSGYHDVGNGDYRNLGFSVRPVRGFAE